MTDDRPLDGLIPGLRPAAGPGRARLIEATLEAGPAWVLALDRDPGGAPALRRWMARHLEAALLARAAAPPPHVLGEGLAGYGVAPLGGVHLFLWPILEGDVERALAPFGLRPATHLGPRWDELRAALAGEDGGPAPWCSFSARVEQHAGLAELHDALVADTREPWGAQPGRPAERLLRAAAGALGRPLSADSSGLDAVEGLLVSRRADVIRWLPPLLLQALADLIGVVAHRAHGAEVAWAECAPEEDGHAPPPLLRVQPVGAAEPAHLPIAQHLVEWCVMPLAAGESPPALSAWLAHEVAPHG